MVIHDCMSAPAKPEMALEAQFVHARGIFGSKIQFIM